MRALDPRYDVKPFRFFLKTNKSQIPLLVANVVFYSLGTLAVLGAVYSLGRTIDILNANGSPRLFVILIAACLVAYECSYRIGHMFEIRAISNIRNSIKKTLFDHTASLSFGYFADRFAGEIAHKVSVTADAFERMTKVVTNNFFEDGVALPSAAILLATVHGYYAAFMVVWSILFMTGSVLLTKEFNRRSGDYADAEAKTTGSLVDMYGNISAVKVYGSRSDSDRLHGRIDAETRSFRRFGWWEVLIFHYHGLGIVTMCIGLLALTVYLFGHGLISVGAIVIVASTAHRLFSVAWEFGVSFADFIKMRGEAIRNLGDLVAAPSVLDGDHAGVEVERCTRIQYEGVTFGYSAEKAVLDDFSIVIKPGEKVGVVGLSGAGKTTFANLLLRFFDPQEGRILLNGQSVSDFTQEYLRAHISYISQDTSLFHASIAENIAYGSAAASREDVVRAAKLAFADDFISSLPGGYESVVGERGIKLSGGQRQRIAIARAILADRPLFLLDEATSALDSDSEAKIQSGLGVLMENKTVIAIAHRLSTLSRMDRIIFLEGGKLVEDGTHEELLRREGKYAALWKMQAGGFLPANV